MPINNLSDFKLAEQVCAAAVFLDDTKTGHLGLEHVEAVRHVEFLHGLAHKLAGDRIIELYTEE